MTTPTATRVKRKLSISCIPGDKEYAEYLRRIPPAERDLPDDIFAFDENEVNNNSQIEGDSDLNGNQTNMKTKEEKTELTLEQKSRQVLDSVSSTEDIKVTINKRKVNKAVERVKRGRNRYMTDERARRSSTKKSERRLSPSSGE